MWNRLIAVVEEQAQSLLRTAFGTITREAGDLSAGVYDTQGRMIACPTLALWGDAGIPSETESPLAAWRVWCRDVSGHGIDSGHFMAEENPQATLAPLLPFLLAHAH